MSGCTAVQQTSGVAQELRPQDAAAYITSAFDRYPLVALSEFHGSADTKDFLARLIRQPGFAGKVNDIAIEFGNARYQAIVDRYIAGEPVVRENLRGTWENTTQISDIWSLPMYEEILADIRAVNATLPAGRRFRVLLGDPPIDWREVTSPADDDMNDWRDAHFAWVVDTQVRAGRKALIFVGGGHITRKVIFPNSLIHLLDAAFPGQTHVVSLVHAGTMNEDVAARLRSWPVPSAASVRGTWLGRLPVTAIGNRFSTGTVEEDIDAVLYLSERPLISVGPPVLDDADPRAPELQRRRALARATDPFRGAAIRFEASSPNLMPQSMQPLELVLAEMLRDRDLRVLVKATADRGEPDAQALSLRRAQTVADWLARRGVARERMTPIGCGATRPLWSDDAEEHRAANRRVDIVRHTATAGCQPPASFEWR